MSEQATILRWEAPPRAQHRPGSSGRSRYERIADELRQRPGQWGVVLEAGGNRTAMATHIRRGHILCFTPAGDFDAVARQRRGRTTIYARFLGNGDLP
jgi:hypothetical protein